MQWRVLIALGLLGASLALLMPWLSPPLGAKGDGDYVCPLVRATAPQPPPTTAQGYTSGTRPRNTYPNPDLTLFFNATITTAWKQQPHAEAMLVNTTSGTIVAISTNTTSLNAAYPGAVPIDLAGRHVIPGLVNAHVHYITGGLSLSQLNLHAATSREAFQDAIRAHAGTLSRA